MVPLVQDKHVGGQRPPAASPRRGTMFFKKATEARVLRVPSQAASMDCWREVQCTHPSRIVFVRPSQTLSVSLTGTHCALQCAHCGGQYLTGMVAIEDADAAGMTSCLISGGCDRQGRVPVRSHLTMARALHVGRILNWHVGLIGEGEMRAIAADVDVISFDFVGDDETIHEVYGLDSTVGDYVRTYTMLRQHTRVVPHLTLGLRCGQLSGEYQALRILRDIGLDALVVLVFIPTPGTRYAYCQPPPLAEVADFLLAVRCTLPATPIHLGCMRPGGRYRRDLDALAVWAGVDKIVNPAPSAVGLAEELGLLVKWESECCAIQRP